MKNFFLFFSLTPLRGERKLGKLAASLHRGIKLDQPKRMRMMKRTMSFLGVAGCVLAAGSLYATSVTNTFDDAVGTWLGDCAKSASVSNYTFSAASTAGFPTGKTSPLSGNYVLTVEGVATNTVSGGTTPLVDMMVQAARPDEELEIPEEDAEHVSIAVAVDSEGYFNAYCTTNSSAAGWVKISTTPFDEDVWVRVSLLFDRSADDGAGRCQIRINGEPMMSNFGYLKESGDTTGGAWYKLANSNVGTVKVAGCTAIDEFVYNETSAVYNLPDLADASGVKRSWYDDNGIAWNPGASYIDGHPELTVSNRYMRCLSPFDGETVLEPKSISTTDSSITIGVPDTIVETAGRKVVLDYSPSPTFEGEGTGAQPVTPGQETVTLNQVPNPGSVLYFRLRATDK